MRYFHFATPVFFATTICLLCQSGCWNSDTRITPAANAAENVVSDANDSNDDGGENSSEDEDAENRAVRLKVERLFKELANETILTKGEDVELELAGLKVKKLAGFDVDERNIGFVNAEKDISVTVGVTPLPFSREFRNKFMESLGGVRFDMQYTRDVTVDDKDAVYIFGRQDMALPGDQGIKQSLKHIVGFGDDNYSWVVTATFPIESDEEFSKELLASIMNSKILGNIPEMKGDELGFSIVKPASLGFSNGWGRRYIMTKDGNFPLESTEDCFVKFECPANSIFVPVENRQAFASQFLKVAPTVDVLNVSTKNKITVDGLEGHEFLAVGSESLSRSPLYVYTGVLFDEDRFYTMTGWYGTVDESTDYLDDLKAMFRSFKRND